MSRAERIVVVGAGLCGLRAAERLRELGFEGDVVIVGNEPTPPYHRPALSKQLLQGTMRPDDLLLPAYQNVNAKWRLNTPVQYLLPRSRTLRLPGDEELKYDGLIIATGVEARRANEVPYEDPRVCVMRTLPDALDFERVLSENRSGPVVVVGGGFTGCELASSLRSLGREVTLIQRGKSLLGNVLGQDLGNWLTKMHGDHGVDLALGNSVKRWAPREDGVALQLSDGSTMLAACVMLATGTVPSTAWLRGSGLPLDNGVVCEATTHVVGAEDVVAAGDVAQWPNIRFDNVPRRIEHWLNAIEMGRAAAENLLAGRAAAKPFTPMPRFWTEQYGVRIQAAGVPKLGPDVVELGSPNDGTGTVVGYAKDGRLMGVVGVDCPSSVMAWTESVARQNPIPGQQPAEADSPVMPAQPALAPPAPAPVAPAPVAPAPAASAPREPAGTTRRAPATSTRQTPAERTRRPAAATGNRLVSAAERQPRTRGFAASAERKKGRHALPPKEPRRPRETQQAEAADPAASNARMMPADPAASNARMMPADPMASNARMMPADPAASNARMMPADPMASNARMMPADPMASNPGMPPVDPTQPHPGRGGLVDSDGRLVDSTGRIGRIDANGDLVPDSPMGPSASQPRMQPVGNGGRAMPMGRGPAESSARMRPPGRMMPGGRPGPEDSYDRLPAVPPINDQLRSAGSSGRGPGSSGRMRPVDPWRGPEDSYDRMPPVDRDGRGPVDSHGRARPANGFRPGPEDSYDRMPPAYQGGRPVDSYTRLPPVNNPAYEPPRLGPQPWEGGGPSRNPWGPQPRGPEDSYDRMPPARLGPEDSYDQFPPARLGPESSYGAFPPARRLGPEDSYDQFPPARGPVDSNGRLHPVQRRRH
jgi:NADPH-dependent 2,4-dienoyl-CoA reductase/sulfur reductase-like enzyme